jgi:putative inorganic carbon (HCO3(-)) transporter
MVLFQILAEILAAAWMIKWIFGDHGLALSGKKLRVFILGLSFLLALSLATLFSPSPEYSFLGSYERRMGLLSWLHFFVLFTVLILENWQSRDIRLILNGVLIASGLVVFYAIVQFFGINIWTWQWVSTRAAILDTRIFATFGQPNFLASWLLLVIPLNSFCFFYFKNKYQRILISALTLLCFVTLLLTQSRGAWLGFLAEIIFFIGAYLFIKNKKRTLRIFLVIFLVLLIGYILLNIFSTTNSSKKVVGPTLFYRLKSLVLVKGVVSTYTRLLSWRIALQSIVHRPVLGYGPEMFVFEAIRYYQPSQAIYETINTFPDRAHNDFLDITLNAGLIGLLFYVALLVTIFYYSLRFIKNNLSHIRDDSALVLALTVGLFGYLASLQFNFHDIQIVIYFWLYLGLVVFLTCPTSLLPKQERQRNIWYQGVLSVLVIILMATVIWFFNLRVILADLYYRQAYMQLKDQKIKQSLKNFDKIFSLQPEQPYYREGLAINITGLVNSVSPDNSLKLINLSIEALNDNDPHARSFFARLYLVQLYSLRAQLTQSAQDFQEAENEFIKLSQFSPKIANIYNEWCQLKIYEEDWTSAAQTCQMALDLYPDLNDPNLNDIHRREIVTEKITVYDKLGEIHLARKEYSLALSTYWIILHLDPWQHQYYKKIADVYYLRRDLGSAIKYNLRGYSLSPKDYNWPLAIAMLYREQGNNKMALRYVNETLSLQKDNPSAQSLLKELKKEL